jgi:hypothetical protein
MITKEYYINKDGQVACREEWERNLIIKNSRTGGNLSFDDLIDLGMLSFLREEYQEIFNQ